jgi:hypothetical protein
LQQVKVTIFDRDLDIYTAKELLERPREINSDMFLFVTLLVFPPFNSPASADERTTSSEWNLRHSEFVVGEAREEIVEERVEEEMESAEEVQVTEGRDSMVAGQRLVQGVIVVQADTREADTFYLQDTMAMNKRACQVLGYQYQFVNYAAMHAKTGLNAKYLKIHVVADQLRKMILLGNYSKMIFMDADAWIQSTGKLRQLVQALTRTPDRTRGFISRDPLGGWGTRCEEAPNEGKNEPYTLINSGAFILKVTERNHLLFNELARNVETCKLNLFVGVMPSFDQVS